MTEDQTSYQYLDDLALKVGAVIVAFTQLEHTLTVTIAAILDLNDLQERALVRPMSITNKTSLLKLLAKEYTKEPFRGKILKTLKAIEDAADNRNNLAHGFYAHRGNKLAILSFSGASKLTGKPVAWTVENLKTLLSEIVFLRNEIQELRAHFPAEKPTPKTPDPIDPPQKRR